MRRLIALLTVLVPCLMTTAEARGQVQSSRPNVIMLVLDDQDAYTPFWDAMPVTAALVHDRGMNFTTAIAPTPICTPGRVTILSGRLAHNTGVYTLTGPYGFANYASQTPMSFPVLLSQLGYFNAHIGKDWKGGGGSDPGWHYWCSLGGNNLYSGTNYSVIEQWMGMPGRNYLSAKYSTDFIADRAEAVLTDLAAFPGPFCLMLTPTAPHLPLPPAQRHNRIATMLWKGQLPIRPNYNEPDVSDKSSWLIGTATTRSAAVPYANGEYHKRMGSLLAVDEMMLRLFRLLLAQGKWENTVVIVTSDNGYNLGSHRLIHKQAPYEESIRVPLSIAGPGIPHDTVDRIVGLHDLAPTLVELAGGPPPVYMDGKSLVPFLNDGSEADVPSWRTSIITEYDTGGVTPGYNPGGRMGPGYELDIPTYRSIRTEDFKYIAFTATGEEELYALGFDPEEQYNLLKLDPISFGPLRDALHYRMLVEMAGAGPTSP